MGREYGLELLVLTAVCGLVCGQECLLNRLDVLPCEPRGDTNRPQQNQYAIYGTAIRTRDVISCRYRDPERNPDNEIIMDISTLGTEDLRFIHSPGFLTETRYPNRILVQYNIQCGANQLAFYNITSINLQPADCNGRCVDYVEVDRGDGLAESCGTDATNNQIQLERSEFTVQLRTSEGTRRPGFQAYIICYDPMVANAPGCTEVRSNRTRRFSSWEERITRRRAFHQVWKEWCQCEQRNVIRTELVIQGGEELQYRSQVISIRSGGGELTRISDVIVLNVNEGSEEAEVYYGSALTCAGFITFPGPAHLIVVARQAWLQPLEMPTPEETDIIEFLMEDLYTLLDPETDDVIPDLVGSGFGNNSFPTRSPGKRQVEEAVLSDEAIRQALLNENACDAILRTAARATLVVANRQDPTRVDAIRSELFG